ncbi:hypothetical protein B0H14DRAFT_2840964 [Mycena olivaceomarginata]|nr:hypothetical protein B0H14DRAFT_2840964 [Mycena olivaceomarginata]
MSQRQTIPYQELASDDGDVLQGKNDSTSRISHYFSTGVLVFCLICTVANIVLLRLEPPPKYSFPSSTTFLTSRGVSRKDLDNLRRPSQFVGFEKLQRVGTPATKSFVNFPLVLAQIDSSDPTRTAPPFLGVFTNIGTIYPELGRVVVSKSISTVVQFRALDFGMEACEIRIALPINASAVSGNRPLTLPSSPIAIFSLEHDKPLHADSLSYSSRPPRGDKIADISLGYGSVWNHHFKCQMDDMYAFELACPSLGSESFCDLAWEQDKDHDSLPAITMIQHSIV